MPDKGSNNLLNKSRLNKFTTRYDFHEQEIQSLISREILLLCKAYFKDVFYLWNPRNSVKRASKPMLDKANE